MELSHPLSRVTRHLLRASAGAVEVYVHSPQEATRGLHIVVCEWQRDPRKRLKASGVARSRLEAYVKAVAELGEVALCDGTSLPNRTGVAGGLISANAVLRAKAELLERDAFLFHYRNRVPFLKREPASSDSCLFEMSSAQDRYYCFIALDKAGAEGRAECILMGLGSHVDRRTAADKALGELACAALDHSMRPGMCRDIYEGKSPPARLTDLHHASSRDPRNIGMMRALCQGGTPEASRSRGALSGEWRVERLASPLRYFEYVRVSHDGLALLEFGQPEPASSPDDAPLYHPVW